MESAKETMKEVSDVVACVVDRGTFFPVAERLARGFKHVYYNMPNGESFETVAKAVMGHGHDNLTGIREFWPLKKEIDLFVFPDCRDWGMQLELQSQGFQVWGSRGAEDLEVLRGYWLEVAKEIGLPMPHTEVVKGLQALRDLLEESQSAKKYIKIDRYRGDMETWCADEDWAKTRTKLDMLAAKWGPFQDSLTFYVQDDLETDVEGGADTYNVQGDYPDEVIIGYEKKDWAYFGAVMPVSEMPPVIWKPHRLLAPVLKEYGYCNFISSEVRVVDAESYLLDPCCRCPSPAGEEQLEMYKNFEEIVWHGANGELVQPNWAAKYCGELVIKWEGDSDSVKSIRVPENVRQWVKLYACKRSDDCFHFPAEQADGVLGCAVGIGDTPDEVIGHLNQIREALSDQPIEMRVEPMAELITTIEKAREEDIEFGDGKELPDPASVLDSVA